MNNRGEIVRSGNLTKSPPEKPGKVAQWHKRWFVLADSRLVYPLAARYVRLEYYQSENEVKKLADPKGVINLNSCTQVTNREPIKGHKYVFDLCTADRVYHLAAESAEDKREWMATLNRLLFLEQENGRTQVQGLHGRRSPTQGFRKQRNGQVQRPLSFTGTEDSFAHHHPSSSPPSRPLPPLPTQSEPKRRPLPPTPDQQPPFTHHHSPPHPPHPLQQHSGHVPQPKPRRNLPLPSQPAAAQGPTRVIAMKERRAQSQPIDISDHYEVGPGQTPLVHTPPPGRKPRLLPKPKLPHSYSADSSYSGSHSYSADSSYSGSRVPVPVPHHRSVDADYSYATTPDEDYSYLQESSVPGYDPDSNDYSHLEMNSRERRTVPETRPHRRTKGYENVPPLPSSGYENVPPLPPPPDDDYSHLTY